MTKSLKAQQSALTSFSYQIDILENKEATHDFFQEKIKPYNYNTLKPTAIGTLQINLGKMCNQVCKHCHVDAGPDRKEIMTRDTMQHCLDTLSRTPSIHTVDMTGGAPEMNPNFRWFVDECKKLGKKIIVRCNLTIILANKSYHDLPDFFRQHEIEVVSSLPFYSADRTDRQRGDGVFDKSIKALQMLNQVGYGKQESGLTLNLVYNPAGAFMPPPQAQLEKDFRIALKKDFDIEFNNLFAITNLPISRFLDYLIVSQNYDKYMEKLISAFNPLAVANVMCRSIISVSYDGYLYDCDFNQMLDLKVATPTADHISTFNVEQLTQRNIILGRHCFGCTAGSGSSCGGEVVKN